MAAIKTAFDNAFRDYQTEGVPSSGAHEPIKGDIRALGTAVETAIAGRLIHFATVALLLAEDAPIKYADGEHAVVFGRVAAGDLRPFIVKWSAASTATHDGSSVFRPAVGLASTGAGRWLRASADSKQAFAPGVATPSIANGEIFETAGATAITQFLDGYEAQIFTVERGATDIVITHDAAKIDVGGSSMTLTSANKRAVFQMVGGVAKLLASSVPRPLVATGGSASRSMESRFADTLVPADWGAAGDGVTNDRTALGAALPYMFSRGEVLNGVGRRYSIGDTGLVVSLTAGKTARLRDCVIDVSALANNSTLAGGGAFKAGLVLQGGDMFDAGYAKTTLSAAATRGDDTISVTSAAGLVPGMAILLHEDALWISTYAAAKKSEAHKIKSISGSVLTLCARVEGTYSTAATVRAYPTADVILENVEFIGGGAGLAQIGLLIGFARNVSLDGVRTLGCESRGVGVWNCFGLEADRLRFDGSNQTGFGYGLTTGGTHAVNIGSVKGRDCRHVVANGGGLGGSYPLTRQLSIESIEAIGCTDGALNMHPGVARANVGSITATGQNDATTSGDGVIINGSNVQLGRVRLEGFRRHGLVFQPYGDGDGVRGTIQVGSLHAVGSGPTNTYGLVFDDASAVGAFDAGCLSIGHIESVTRNGVYIRTPQNSVDRLYIGGGRIVASAAGFHGLKVESSANGAVRDIGIFGTHFECPATSGLFALYLQGNVTVPISRAAVVGCSSQGGQYGMAAEYATVDYTAFRAAGFVTAATVAGTGATLNAIT